MTAEFLPNTDGIDQKEGESLSLSDPASRFKGHVKDVVDDITLHVHENKTACVVGESGCDGIVIPTAMIGPLPARFTQIPPEKLATGDKLTPGDIEPDLSKQAPFPDMRNNRVSMILQEPMTSPNPAFRNGDQNTETVQHYRGGARAEAQPRALTMLQRAGTAKSAQPLPKFPHQLPDGIRQPVVIAMALANGSQILQARMLDLIRGQREETGTGTIMATRGQGAVVEIVDNMACHFAPREATVAVSA